MVVVVVVVAVVIVVALVVGCWLSVLTLQLTVVGRPEPLARRMACGLHDCTVRVHPPLPGHSSSPLPWSTLCTGAVVPASAHPVDELSFGFAKGMRSETLESDFKPDFAGAIIELVKQRCA